MRLKAGRSPQGRITKIATTLREIISKNAGRKHLFIDAFDYFISLQSFLCLYIKLNGLYYLVMCNSYFNGLLQFCTGIIISPIYFIIKSDKNKTARKRIHPNNAKIYLLLPFFIHVTRKVEYLKTVAELYGRETEELLKINDLEFKNYILIQENQLIKITLKRK